MLAIFGKIATIDPSTNSSAQSALGDPIPSSDPHAHDGLVVNSVMVGAIYFGLFLGVAGVYLYKPRTHKFHGYA